MTFRIDLEEATPSGSTSARSLVSPREPAPAVAPMPSATSPSTSGSGQGDASVELSGIGWGWMITRAMFGSCLYGWCGGLLLELTSGVSFILFDI
jgi:hypothetical protein